MKLVCNVREGQFMISNNPSLKKDDDINSEFFKDFFYLVQVLNHI